MTRRLSIIMLTAVAALAHADTLDGVCDIRFSATSTLHDFTGADTAPAIAPGPGLADNVVLALRIRTANKILPGVISNIKEDSKRISCLLRFSVSLTDFDLNPGSILGVIRVGDKVDVEAAVTLTKPSHCYYLKWPRQQEGWR